MHVFQFWLVLKWVRPNMTVVEMDPSILNIVKMHTYSLVITMTVFQFSLMLKWVQHNMTIVETDL